MQRKKFFYGVFMRTENIDMLQLTYKAIKPKIDEKLQAFRNIWKAGDNKKIFKELLFCLLTPQSKAESAWEIIENLEKKNLLLRAKENILRNELRKIRFKNKKAEYIKNAQGMFVDNNGKIKIVEIIENFKSPTEAREWLADKVKGMGYKEASHFLRNIGKGEDLTILDRHILKALVKFGIIAELPNSLNRKKYISIEQRMREFSKETDIPLAHLDFVLWQIQTKRIFK